MELQTITLEEVKKYNEQYARGDFRGSEARPYNIENMQYFIEKIQKNYTYTKACSGSGWMSLDIKTSHSKYGTNYIYIDHERKLWRDSQTITEFYGGGCVYD